MFAEYISPYNRLFSGYGEEENIEHVSLLKKKMNTHQLYLPQSPKTGPAPAARASLPSSVNP